MMPLAATSLRASVVVPTHKRPALLKRCLEALLVQRLPPEHFEIIVVDDGHDEAARQVVRTLAARAGIPRLRYLRPERGRGPAAARNCGWRAALGEVVAFTDDDTIAHPQWLATGLRTLTNRPGWPAAAGRVVVPRHQRRPSDPEHKPRGAAKAGLVTANAFVRRSALERIGGFDERFTQTWCEDLDLQFRLFALGPIGRVRDAVVVHPLRRERWGVCLRQQRSTYFDALLYKKHPRLYRERIRRLPPWDYYAVVACAAAALGFGASRDYGYAALALALALLLVLQVALRRMRPAERSWAHVAEMLVTSALIPFLSVYWRLRGAWRFRVLFL
jgi:GT2 family glycosyltransferase